MSNKALLQLNTGLEDSSGRIPVYEIWNGAQLADDYRLTNIIMYCNPVAGDMMLQNFPGITNPRCNYSQRRQDYTTDLRLIPTIHFRGGRNLSYNKIAAPYKEIIVTGRQGIIYFYIAVAICKAMYWCEFCTTI